MSLLFVSFPSLLLVCRERQRVHSGQRTREREVARDGKGKGEYKRGGGQLIGRGNHKDRTFSSNYFTGGTSEVSANSGRSKSGKTFNFSSKKLQSLVMPFWSPSGAPEAASLVTRGEIKIHATLSFPWPLVYPMRLWRRPGGQRRTTGQREASVLQWRDAETRTNRICKSNFAQRNSAPHTFVPIIVTKPLLLVTGVGSFLKPETHDLGWFL